ncbi:HNH endonuclease [Sphaerisporangium siamense]|uniref:HNH nuclease domain-containing protein n=1 Tax=Sphaerisporangium siamense TaxID=795645 RepID=A0A7W7G6A2_9ACTN|nr:HNH endonuclease [Sphaerisporangium siamense]MBB4699323.1 hypothetical protein [Sphaerisporangium siamense]
MNVQTVLDFEAVTVLASSRRGPVPILLDLADAERLDGRRLSLGSHGYAQLRDGGERLPVHRWVLGAQRGDGRIVDHINGDPYDCRRSNLRFVTAAENSANRRTTAASGFRGVCKRHGRWAAQGKVRGRAVHLGTYDTVQEAAWVAHEWRLANLPGYLGRGFTSVPTVKPVAA